MGVLVCVDAADGVMLNTEKGIKQACLEGLSICLMITKIDRLIVELKIPPADAYHKIRHIIAEVNSVISMYAPDRVSELTIDCHKGNVCFSSAYYNIVFTLESFAKLYCSTQNLE